MINSSYTIIIFYNSFFHTVAYMYIKTLQGMCLSKFAWISTLDSNYFSHCTPKKCCFLQCLSDLALLFNIQKEIENLMFCGVHYTASVWFPIVL